MSDADEIIKGLEEMLKESAKAVLDGSAKDLERFAEEMTRDLSTATLVGDTETVDTILAQSRALAALAGVRANDQAWQVFMNLSSKAVSLVLVLVRVAGGAL